MSETISRVYDTDTVVEPVPRRIRGLLTEPAVPALAFAIALLLGVIPSAPWAIWLASGATAAYALSGST